MLTLLETDQDRLEGEYHPNLACQSIKELSRNRFSIRLKIAITEIHGPRIAGADKLHGAGPEGECRQYFYFFQSDESLGEDASEYYHHKCAKLSFHEDLG